MSNTQALKELTEQTGTGWLGRGIDLFKFDPFGTVPNAKPTRILAASPLAGAGVIGHDKVPSLQYEETYADSLLEISHTLAIKAGLKGSYGGFSGSVNSKFGSSEQRIEKRHEA